MQRLKLSCVVLLLQQLVAFAPCSGEGVGVSHLLTTTAKLQDRNKGPLEVGGQLNDIVKKFYLSNGITAREYVFETGTSKQTSSRSPSEGSDSLSEVQELINSFDCRVIGWARAFVNSSERQHGKLIALFKDQTMIAFGLFDISLETKSRCAKLEALCSSGKAIGVRGAGAAATLSFIASMLTGDIVRELPVGAAVDLPHLCIETLPLDQELPKYYAHFGFVPAVAGDALELAMFKVGANLEQLERFALQAAHHFRLDSVASGIGGGGPPNAKSGSSSSSSSSGSSSGSGRGPGLQSQDDVGPRVGRSENYDSSEDDDPAASEREKQSDDKRKTSRKYKDKHSVTVAPRRRRHKKKGCTLC